MIDSCWRTYRAIGNHLRWAHAWRRTIVRQLSSNGPTRNSQVLENFGWNYVRSTASVFPFQSTTYLAFNLVLCCYFYLSALLRWTWAKIDPLRTPPITTTKKVVLTSCYLSSSHIPSVSFCTLCPLFFVKEIWCSILFRPSAGVTVICLCLQAASKVEFRLQIA